MESIQASDAAVLGELQRWLRAQLHGDGKQQGMYYLVAHNMPSWEVYQNLAGRIAAFETVLAQIEHIANSRGAGLEEKVVFSRSGLN